MKDDGYVTLNTKEELKGNSERTRQAKVFIEKVGQGALSKEMKLIWKCCEVQNGKRKAFHIALYFKCISY